MNQESHGFIPHWSEAKCGSRGSVNPGDLFDYSFDGDGNSPTSVDIQPSVKEASGDKQSPGFNQATKASARVVWLVPNEESA
ncbi:hypothetical protein BZZ01_10605 [Nostocales cyanobacterium HT-58-2]|nr:hypothetical protein BZZ01_10605 [Nostocales cyanobacterium HT-58-2]